MQTAAVPAADVTISIPCHRSGPYIAQAVESLLGQTYRNLTVVVVNDGDPDPPWPLLAHLGDPRLVRFDLSANYGRYFADAVVLEWTTSPYFLVQDSDDWSDPKRVETLLLELRRQHAGAAVSARLVEGVGASQEVQQWPLVGTPLADRMEHRINHQGLFRVDALRRVGGFHPGFRIGYDTLLMNLLEMVDRVVAVDTPLYYARVRPGSLTTSPDTGFGSRQRAAAHGRLERLYTHALQVYRRYLTGATGADELAGAIRRLVLGSSRPADVAALRTEVTRLSRVRSPVNGR